MINYFFNCANLHTLKNQSVNVDQYLFLFMISIPIGVLFNFNILSDKIVLHTLQLVL